MAYYKLYDEFFQNKESIKSYVKQILYNHRGKEIEGEDRDILLELISYHDHNYNKDHIVSIESRYEKHDDLHCDLIYIKIKRFWVSRKSFVRIDTIPVSVNRCIDRIKKKVADN